MTRRKTKTATFKVEHTDLDTWGAEENAEKVGPHLFKLKAGARISLTREGASFRRVRYTTVAPSCGKNNGVWYCASCEEVFHNNFEKDGHIHEPEKDHYLVWMCAIHGAEQP